MNQIATIRHYFGNRPHDCAMDANAEWREEAHHRGKGGQFAKGSGGSGSGGSSSSPKKASKPKTAKAEKAAPKEKAPAKPKKPRKSTAHWAESMSAKPGWMKEAEAKHAAEAEKKAKVSENAAKPKKPAAKPKATSQKKAPTKAPAPKAAAKPKAAKSASSQTNMYASPEAGSHGATSSSEAFHSEMKRLNAYASMTTPLFKEAIAQKLKVRIPSKLSLSKTVEFLKKTHSDADILKAAGAVANENTRTH